jgi:hypothetical protein
VLTNLIASGQTEFCECVESILSWKHGIFRLDFDLVSNRSCLGPCRRFACTEDCHTTLRRTVGTCSSNHTPWLRILTSPRVQSHVGQTHFSVNPWSDWLSYSLLEALAAQRTNKWFDRRVRKFIEKCVAMATAIEEGFSEQHGWAAYLQQGTYRCVLKG